MGGKGLICIGDDPWQRNTLRQLQQLKEQGLYRSMRAYKGPQGPAIRMGDRTVLNFCSNNYLGLAADPLLWLSPETPHLGMGAGASRLVCGNSDELEALERETAAFKDRTACLVFPTGYMANNGVIATLCGRDDRIYSDALNHASIIDGCRLSRARVHVYRHRDMDHLSELLSADHGSGLRFIVSDVVFSMDGDLCPLPDMLEIARRYNAYMILDDAHGTGVLGKQGKGGLSFMQIPDDPCILAVVATYSKAMGSMGGFVAGSALLRTYLVNKTRPFIYTTGLPPLLAAVNRRALALCQGADRRRRQLHHAVKTVMQFLKRMGYPHARDIGETPIVPIRVGASDRAVVLDRFLMERGILAAAIRPPTVPEGTARIRLTLMSTHTTNHLARLFDALEQARRAGVWRT